MSTGLHFQLLSWPTIKAGFEFRHQARGALYKYRYRRIVTANIHHVVMQQLLACPIRGQTYVVRRCYQRRARCWYPMGHGGMGVARPRGECGRQLGLMDVSRVFGRNEASRECGG